MKLDSWFYCYSKRFFVNLLNFETKFDVNSYFYSCDLLIITTQVLFNIQSDLISYLDENSFDKNVATGVTLVDFYADWCGPCRMLSPVLEDVAKELKGKAKIAKLDIDNSQKIAAHYQVMSVPTMILFKDGKEVNRLIGLRDAEGVKKFIDSACN